ncbi:hypothetical protein ACH4ZU_25780 [Streptomyces sp. NPDC020472]|uniref:DUF3885 domain-containing protein n=1 Tax=Streptomyces sp. NPDC020472 TaxID=3365075 RepID=UPI00379510D1
MAPGHRPAVPTVWTAEADVPAHAPDLGYWWTLLVADVLITDVRMERIHHPYDGGADVFLTSPVERNRLRARHADWLSRHPAGL